MDVMSKYRFDGKYYERQKKNHDGNKNCNRDDESKEKVETNLYQK